VRTLGRLLVGRATADESWWQQEYDSVLERVRRASSRPELPCLGVVKDRMLRHSYYEAACLELGIPYRVIDIDGVDMAVGGELFVMRMPATTLDTLAKTMVKLLGNDDTQIDIIGRRPGEKKHEALVSHNEAQFAKDIGQGYYVLLPQFSGSPCTTAYADAPDFTLGEYTSENTERLDEAALTAMLKEEAWLFDAYATGPLTL